MNKKGILIILVIILIIALVAGYFIITKINENKRNYTIEEVSEYKYFVVKIGDQYGVIDDSGKTILDATYDKVEIPNPSKDVFICYKEDKGIAYNSSKQQLFAEYNSIEPIELKNVTYNLPYEKSVLKTEKNGKYGLIDFSGNQIFDTEYDSIASFANVEGQLQIEQNGKMGIANIKGTILVKLEYDTIISDDYYSEENGYKNSGYIVGVKNEDGYKYGYINNKGKLKVKIEYNDILRVANDVDGKNIYLIAAKNGQYGVIKNSKNIINNEYQTIEYDNTNNVFILEKSKKYGVADIKGKIIIPVENISVQAKGEYMYVESNTDRQVYDAAGNKENIDFNKSVLPTSNENYKITIDSEENSNYYGVIDNNNNQIIKPEYLYIEYAFDKYFIVCGQNGKLGVLDSSGNEVIELKYDLVQKVQDKDIIQTLQSDTNTTELYSSNMNKICQMENATLKNKDNYIKLYSSTEINYYNNQGEQISSSKLFPNNKMFAAVSNNKWGYVDASGATKINFEYELVTEFNDYGFAAIKQDGKWGCIDSEGKIVVEPTYELSESYGDVEFIGEYLKVQSGFGSEYYTKDV